MECKVFLTNSEAKGVSYLEDALHLNLAEKERFKLVWDQDSPDVLFVSEAILYDQNMLEELKKLYSKAGICVFFPGECISPDLNIFDYAISFSGYEAKDDRVVRMPLRSFFSEYISNVENPIKSIAEAKKLLDGKTGFCNFIYSNPNGHENRKKIFDELSQYKRVDSYGSFLNNMGLSEAGGSSLRELVLRSTEIKSRYKFTIAFENARFPGYTSEKIFTSLEAGTIPIYWGNPDVIKDVNPDAFINCHDFNSLSDVVEKVKEIDENDELWCSMVAQPWMDKKQREAEEVEKLRYHDFLEMIFSKHSVLDRRRPEGTWPEAYQSFWMGRQGGTDKYRINFEVCAQMCSLVQDGKHIYDLINTCIRSVAIYGMGSIGRILFNDLKKCDRFIIPFCIDNRMTVSDLSVDCIRLDDLKHREIPELVVVTVTMEYSTIKESILNLCDTEVISISELLEGKIS